MKGFLFDLDGTLVDTAIDMIEALKSLAAENNIFIDPKYEEYKELITFGSRAIVTSIFGHLKDEAIIQLQKRYLEIYQDTLTNDSSLFDGIATLLSHFDKKNIPWGIVTNKPAYLAKPLVMSLNPLKKCQILIGGDTTNHPKPHPEPINTAIKAMKIDPSKSWYIGDALTDIEAGNSAGMNSAVAMWGYLSKKDKPKAWKAQKLLYQPKDILDILLPL